MEELQAQQESPNRMVWLLLSYLWIAACCAGVFLPAIPLIVEREDEYAKWHAKNGIALALIWFGVSVVLLGLANLFGTFWELGKVLFYLLWGVFAMGYMVLCVIALLKAFEGERWTLGPLRSFLGKLDE